MFRSSCMPVSRGVCSPIYAHWGPSLRESVHERERREDEDAEMTKPLVRPSEGPHESIAKGENVLRPSIRPFDLRFSPPTPTPSRSLTSLLHCVHPLSNTLSSMVSLEELLPIDQPRDLSTATSTDFLVEMLVSI